MLAKQAKDKGSRVLPKKIFLYEAPEAQGQTAHYPPPLDGTVQHLLYSDCFDSKYDLSNRLLASTDYFNEACKKPPAVQHFSYFSTYLDAYALKKDKGSYNYEVFRNTVSAYRFNLYLHWFG